MSVWKDLWSTLVTVMSCGLIEPASSTSNKGLSKTDIYFQSRARYYSREFSNDLYTKSQLQAMPKEWLIDQLLNCQSRRCYERIDLIHLLVLQGYMSKDLGQHLMDSLDAKAKQKENDNVCISNSRHN